MFMLPTIFLSSSPGLWLGSFPTVQSSPSRPDAHTPSDISQALAASLSVVKRCSHPSGHDVRDIEPPGRESHDAIIVIVFAVCFYFSWQLTLILLAVASLLTISSFLVNNSVAGGDSTSKKNNNADAAAGALLTNTIDSIRTVASLGMEKDVSSKYKAFLETSKQTDTRAGVIAGAAFGFSLGTMLLVAVLLFYVSARWISRGTITFEDMSAVLMVFSLSSFSIGSAAQGATDPKKAHQAAANLFEIFDPVIDALSTDGETLSSVKGELEFHDVQFAYPSRPGGPVFEQYSLEVAPGQTVALVGASGCGKSTAIALLERFYDPEAGSVTLDGVDLRQLRLPWLRGRISFVRQEPVLFAGTVAENIALGKPRATREKIVQAAEDSSAQTSSGTSSTASKPMWAIAAASFLAAKKQRIALARGTRTSYCLTKQPVHWTTRARGSCRLH
ncbi:Antigen peptide transporter 2 [Phytophthora pseudosyringae]|uniref:Antigen peptide transporter 2 n=1 Tax=Phytophthora pseudosyringae TaxID=221518 RepID=A0A8T1VNB7_9STRA|nr:Antigen peptide transporter 2 [Phytophthora pseudosyringae]